jgi:hypothetical protein
LTQVLEEFVVFDWLHSLFGYLHRRSPIGGNQAITEQRRDCNLPISTLVLSAWGWPSLMDTLEERCIFGHRRLL